ncbi:MAG: aminoacyl-tRNA hydrolase [Phycisphaerae bacterium]|nr:aminoacyl-tRNA hydrolase [Phycisphaerae bacterium]
MKLIAGLGNPGPRYAGSRHNIGYQVVDELARRWSVDVSRHERRFDALLGDGPIAGTRGLLLKPTTFMNLSGRSVAAAWRYYKIGLPDVLVVHDDLDLPVGKLRLRGAGSAGGHKGLSDVIRHLGTDEVSRLRIGIGKVDRSATVEYVLSAFTPEEREIMAQGIQAAADAVELWMRVGVENAMNEVNRRGPSGSEG